MKRMKNVLAGVFICTASALAAEKPNILFFAVDDMNDWIGPMGYEQAVTPNIDRLAKAGVTFINGHTAGIYCAPSRAAIFSGRYASSTGCYTSALYYKANPDLRPLQVVLQDGYRTGFVGKSHLVKHDWLLRHKWKENGFREYAQDADPRDPDVIAKDLDLFAEAGFVREHIVRAAG